MKYLKKAKASVARFAKSHKKAILITTAATVLLLAALVVWNSKFAPTHVAFVNYQATTLGQIAKSNSSSFIKIHEVPLDELPKLKHMDMVFVNGMGLRIDGGQRTRLERIARRTPTLTTAATNPANYIVSVDSAVADTLVRYLNNGGRDNFRNLLCFVRRNIDRKLGWCEAPQPVAPKSRHQLFRPADDGETGFNSVAAYNTWLHDKGLFSDTAARVVLTGQMGEPADLVPALEEAGFQVYPVVAMRQFVLSGQLDSVNPSAIINMAHGRLGDYMTDWLATHNVPLFSTVYLPQPTEQWKADKMGMSGGFLSQSIVTPEIDGAIRPYALFAHRTNAEGIQEVYAVPDRLKDFVATVKKQVALQRMPNSKKHIAIVYFKGPGQNALTAAGLDVVPSLYNLLVRLRNEGYKVDNLPSSADGLAALIQQQGAVLGTYAHGAFDRFLAEGNPATVSFQQYEQWCQAALPQSLRVCQQDTYGQFPGDYMATPDGQLAVARLQFGNVALLPQPMAGLGDNEFKIVHGTDAAPPYPYTAAYLWARFAFRADALIHFGTHGSLEYTPRKQVALCENDWPDRLVADIPHIYLYTTANVGEALIAKRRSYATIVSHLTPPFLESGVRNDYRKLTESIKTYHHILDHNSDTRKAAVAVKQQAVALGIHRALELDSNLAIPYSDDDISRIDNYAEELSLERMTGRPYILGRPYSSSNVESSVFSMCVDPIAYSLLALDKLNGKTSLDADRDKAAFNQHYIVPAKNLVDRLLHSPDQDVDRLLCSLTGLSAAELAHAREVHAARQPVDMMGMMMNMAAEMPSSPAVQAPSGMPAASPDSHSAMKKLMQRTGMSPEKAMKMAKMMGASDEALSKMKAAMEGNAADAVQEPATTVLSEEEKHDIAVADAVMEVERTIANVARYKEFLLSSPQKELDALVNALGGGFTPPSPGGDPIVNPNVLPTGRNLYGINVENTPTEAAWEKGRLLAENTLSLYRQRHHDSLPRKVSYTLWSGEFIETEGATLAQVLYMLGVEPVRDAFGRVSDLRLIPSARLGRPRIDVCVQTSGQLRDLAASRLFLVSKAVRMAAAADDGAATNYVADGVRQSEKILVDKGLSPRDAREVATFRVFGGVDGNYGTGIQEMVQAGDRWEDEQQIATTYLANMGTYYGDASDWEDLRQNAFEAALAGTDAVIQPRQSNTWGALSLDHVYEFMGGMNLAVRNISGKEPDAYLSDYRNRSHARVQEVKEAISIESRTTLFNPRYIQEMMQGGASAADGFAELVHNTYGWNVMKPQAIDNEMWDEIYEVYVKDKHRLGILDYFDKQNPAALQEMTAVMMESARKGLWKASDEQLHDIASLHTSLVEKHAPSCSPTVCNNAKLQQFVADLATPDQADRYRQDIKQIRETTAGQESADGVRLKRDSLSDDPQAKTSSLNNLLVVLGVATVLAVAVVMLRRRHKNESED